MYDSRISPIFTWTLVATDKRDALQEAVQRLVEPTDESYTISLERLSKMIKTFAVLYIYKARELGLASFSETELASSLKELGFRNVKPTISLLMSNIHHRLM